MLRCWRIEKNGDRRGFALLIVLWTLVLIALVIGHLASSARTETRIAGNLRQNAAAEALADGAAYEAIFRLLDMSDRHWPADGAVHKLRYADAVATVRAQSLDGKLNPNRAAPEVIDALLQEIGTDQGMADRVAAAIVDWRSPPSADRPMDAKLAAYRAAGLDYGPPADTFESLDELGRVLGMTPAILQRIRPHLSVYADAETNTREADPVVARALQRAAVATGTAAASTAPQAPPTVDTVAIEADIDTAGGAHVSRFAVVRTDPSADDGYAILYWDHSPAE